MRRLALTALALGCAGCSPQQLQGSLSVVLDLTYKTSDLTVANDQAALRFLRPEDTTNIRPDAGAVGAEDVVLKVITNLNGVPVTANKVFDLTAVLPNGSQAGQLSRNVLNDPLQSFPPIQRGEFVVHQNPVKGQSVSGYFSVTFSEGIDPASGRTVYANFSAKVL